MVSVPLAFLLMVPVSLRDRRPNPAAEMLTLHAPEGLGLGLAEDGAPAERAGGLARGVASPVTVPTETRRAE